MDCASDGVICAKAMATETNKSLSFIVSSCQRRTLRLLLVRAPSMLPGAVQRYRLGVAFSSPSPIVLITVLYFSAITIFQALVERFAFLDYANSLQDVGYLFGLNNDCLALCLASPSNGSQFVLGKPFANVTLSETCFPLFTVSLRCPCCQEQRSDAG